MLFSSPTAKSCTEGRDLVGERAGVEVRHKGKKVTSVFRNAEEAHRRYLLNLTLSK